MADIQELYQLRKLDQLACEFLNSLRDTHDCDAAQSCTVLSIMWGRLRKAAVEMGIDPQTLDDQFIHDAKIFTEVLDSEEVLEEDENGG